MAYDRSTRTTKGLPRSKSFQNHFAKSIKHTHKWSNTPIKSTKLIKLSILFYIGATNIRLSDIPNNDLHEYTSQSGRMYLQILMTVYIKGKTSKTTALKSTGMISTSIKLINDQLLPLGYLRDVQTLRTGKDYTGQTRSKYWREIELTTKGYNFINEIFKLILDEELF